MKPLLLVLCCITVACAGDMASSVDPSADYVCANALDPIAFRIVFSPDGVRSDTTSRYENRYLVPHRRADTVVHGDALIRFAGVEGYCITVFDSLVHHLPNAKSWVPTP